MPTTTWSIYWHLGDSTTYRESPMAYNPHQRATYQSIEQEAVMVCTREDDRWRGLTIRVVGTLSRTHWWPDDKHDVAAPWYLSSIKRLEVERDEHVPVATMFRDVGLGGLYRECNQVFTELARLDPNRFGAPTGIPKTGPKGEPELYYALLVRDYLAAIDEHGQRGFMEHLIAGHPRQLKRSSILRNLDRAEHLGLITDRPGRGKAGGIMTARCQVVLTEANKEGLVL